MSLNPLLNHRLKHTLPLPGWTESGLPARVAVSCWQRAGLGPDAAPALSSRGLAKAEGQVWKGIREVSRGAMPRRARPFVRSEGPVGGWVDSRSKEQLVG